MGITLKMIKFDVKILRNKDVITKFLLWFLLVDKWTKNGVNLSKNTGPYYYKSNTFTIKN